MAESPLRLKTRTLPAARRLASVTSFLGLFLCALQTAANEKTLCIESHATAQELRDRREFVAARTELVLCAAKSCPKAVREDCSRMLAALDSRLPTVVFYVRTGQGDDLSEARVSVDGDLVQSRLDGSAVPINPGPRLVTFELADGTRVEKRVVVREGERLRSVGIDLEKQVKDEPSSDRDVDAEPGPGVGPYLLAGVGVAGVASFTLFALQARSKEQDLAACSPSCGPERRGDYDEMRRNYLIGDVSLGIGVVALVGATYWFLSYQRPGTSTGAGAASVRVGLTPQGLRAAGAF